MTKHRSLAGALACGLFAVAGTVRADAVTDWNEITMATVTSKPGPVAQLDVALVHLAIHDAVQAIDRRYEPYHVEVRGAQGSRSAAAAAAAHGVLVGLYPANAQTLDNQLTTYLANNGLSNDPGLAVGEHVAERMLPLRRAAPNPLPPPFVGGTGPGLWRPTESYNGNPPAPPSFSPMLAPWMATTDPYTLTGPARFRPAPPPALDSERYAKEYNEVKALGALVSTTRTAEQTDIAYFFTDNIFAQWNRAMRALATQHVHKIGDSARMFAIANTATADAVLASWDSKKHYVFWRPVTAIQEGELDGNAYTIGDAGWRPLINTPNYPDYTSGANAVTGAMTRSLQLFFGTDKVPFELTSAAPAAVKKTRTYARFSDAAREVVEARVYAGIHFRFADEAGRVQGRQVAEWVSKHFMTRKFLHYWVKDAHYAYDAD